MVSIQFVYDGCRELCDQWTDQLYAQCHLFVNPAILSIDTVLADLTEATYPGYYQQNISGWSPATVQGSGATSWSDPIVFGCAGGMAPEYVYGYYVTRGSPGRLLWAELRPQGPIRMWLDSDLCVVLPSLTLTPSL